MDRVNEFASLRILSVAPEMRHKCPTITDEIDVLSTPPPVFLRGLRRR